MPFDKESRSVKSRLRVAITADPYLPVPPKLYGGIERIVDFLVAGLIGRGHRVTLLAHPASSTRATLIPYGCPPHFGPRARIVELLQVGGALWKRRNQFDLIHSFGRLAALTPVLPLRRLPKIQSYQREIPDAGGIRQAVRLAGDSLRFTACSSSVYSGAAGRHGEWTTIFNGVDLSKYRFARAVEPDAPLIFLGRMEPFKGPHHAIAIAKAAGRRLILAGNRIEDAKGLRYFASEIQPHLDDDRVRWVGPVDDAAKNALLGAAAALLMPIDWEEPFGIVMAEALACGTPVIAFDRGSVPEVVRDGVNGFRRQNVEEAAAAVSQLGRIDRAAVRKDCEERFGSNVIVDAYEKLYRSLCADRAGG